ncbi:hypothetical protein J2T08_005727 [Neorhizobium galegae]|nr:hypothetical protein [Neorhizobium galegae]
MPKKAELTVGKADLFATKAEFNYHLRYQNAISFIKKNFSPFKKVRTSRR